MEKILNIDPEFQGKIPPLTEQEFAQLEQNILEAGRVYEPIATWNNTIVDGHNRYKIVTKHPEIIWETREMNFDDKWAAFDWMYKNQLGRRNLTAEQRAYLLGKLYEARKHTHGGQVGNKNAEKRIAEKRPFVSNRDGVSKIVADEQGVGKTTVKNAYLFSKGIDEIRQDDPELADNILTAKTKVSMGSIQDVAKASPESRPEMIAAIKDGKRITDDPNQRIKPQRADLSGIRSIIDSMTSSESAEYNIDNLVEQIGVNADAFVRTISNLIMDHADICNENREIIARTIDEKITDRINQIKERLNDGKQL